MTENKINFDPAADAQDVMAQAVQNVLGMLVPYTIVLSDTDRKTMAKMSDATLPFVEKVGSYIVSHPQFKPAYVNADELLVDINGYKISNRLLGRVNELQRLLEDITIQSGSEAYTSALMYYRNLKGQVRDGVPGAKVVFDDLQQRFAGQGKTSTPAK